MKSNDIVSHIHHRQAAADIPNPGSPPKRWPSSSRSHRTRRYETQLRYFKLLSGAAGVTALIMLVLAKFAIEGLEAQNQASLH